MSQNYETLQTKITEAMQALTALRAAKDDTAEARSELAQIQAHIANLAAFLTDQNRILAPDEAAKSAALARVNALAAKRQILHGQKTTLISERDMIIANIATLDGSGPGSIPEAQDAIDLEDEHADYHDKSLVLLKNDLPSGSNVAPATPSGGFRPGENQYVPSDGLAYLMEQRRDSEVNLKALRDSLAALEAEYAAHTDPPPSLQASITARRTEIETDTTNLAAINAKITNQIAHISNKQSDLVTSRQLLSEKIQDKRELLDQREVLLARLTAKKVDLSKVSDELQNIEGQVLTGTPPVNANEDNMIDITTYPYGTGANAYPVGSTPAVDPSEFVSELYLAKRIYDSLSDTYAARQAIIDDVIAAKASAETAAAPARTAVTVAEADELTAQSTYDLKKQTLKIALDLQITYEVNAAVQVLDAFLRLRSAVLSSAVQIDVSVQEAVDKTFISSKVRAAFESVKGALTSPTEYRVVLAQIQADPVGFFFNNTADQDLSDLTPAEIEAFKKAIRDKFRVEAARVFGRNGLGGNGGPVMPQPGQQQSQTSLLKVLIVLALIALAVYVLVTVVLPRMR